MDPGNIEISKIHFNIQQNSLVPASILDFPEFWQNSAEFSTKKSSFSLNFSKILQQSEEFAKDCKKSEKNEFGAVRKCATIVELKKYCKAQIYLQNSASIQPRTSPPKIGKQLQTSANFATVKSF